MKLTLENLTIKDMQFGDATRLENGVLYVDKSAIEEFARQEPLFAGANVSIARPGENVRVVNIVDCIEPRCKVSGGDDWPGVLADYSTPMGNGVTRCLKGVSILLCDNNNDYARGLGGWGAAHRATLDMSGPGAAETLYSKLVNLVIEPFTQNGDLVDEAEFAWSLRRVSYKTSVMLARVTLECKPDSTETLDNETHYEGLPSIAYMFQPYSKQYDYNSINDPIFYAYPVPDMFPTIVQPTEIIDGAVASMHGYRLMETYSIQNHPIILELFRRHGKELNFSGLVMGVVSLDAKRRQLTSIQAANLFSEVLKVDGVIMSKGQGGAPNICLGNVASECERRGIKTVLQIQILNCASNLSTEVLFDDPQLNAIVQTGVYFDRMELPPVETIYGGTKKTRILSDMREQYASEGLDVQSFRLFGKISHTGINDQVAVEY